MNDDVFLVFSERVIDSEGTLEFTYNADRGPGWFPSREEAQQWVTDRTARSQRAYDRAMWSYLRDKVRAEKVNEKIHAEQAALKKQAVESGADFEGEPLSMEHVTAPDRADFFVDYDVVEIHREIVTSAKEMD